MTRCIMVFFLLLAGLPVFLHAQDPYAVTITREDGLPSDAVYDIYQDHLGFIWFATDEGLCRYDGKKIKTYTSPQLTFRAGTCIREDRFGRIWYTNFDNQLYYVEHDSLHRVPVKTQSANFIKFAILADHLVVVGDSGANVLDIQTFRLQKHIEMEEALEIVQSANTVFIQYNKRELLELDAQMNMHHHRIPDGAGEAHVWEAGSGRLFLVDRYNREQVFYTYQPSGEIQPWEFPYEAYISNICSFANELWICTRNGVYRAVPYAGRYRYDHLFPGFGVSCVIRDRDGNYWISTTTNGVLFVPSMTNSYYRLPGVMPGKLQVAGNQLLVGGGNNTITSVDLITHAHTRLFESKNNHEVSCFWYDTTTGQLLVSSDQLYRVDPGGERRSWSMAVKEMVGLDDKYMGFAASGSACSWVYNDQAGPSPWDSLSLVEPNNNLPSQGFYNILSGVRARSLVLDTTAQCLYVATGRGVYAITPKGVTMISYRDELIHARRLLMYRQHLIILQNNGRLMRRAPDGAIVELPFSTGGAEEPVNNIILQGDELFLVTQAKGVFIAVLRDGAQRIHKLEELQDNEVVRDIVVWKDNYIISCSDGLLFLGRTGGIRKRIVPALLIQTLRIDGRTYPANDKIRVPYYRNDVAIDYSILAFTTNFNHPLYYRINGGDWKLLPAETRSLQLSSLRADTYRIDFRLEGEEQIQSVYFTINRPLWQMPGFWIACILLILAAGTLLYRRRLNAINRRSKLVLEKMELEKNLDKSILTSIKAQMNPHFFYNALNTIQAFIFSDDKKNASSYLSKFSRLTRMILEMSERELILLSEEIEALQLYLDLEKVRFNDRLDAAIELGSGVSPEDIRIPPMMIQPYVENAIKHGLLHKKNEAWLRIRFHREEERLVVTVEDNGIGRKRSAELNSIKEGKPRSFATEANLRRLDILNRGKKEVAVQYIDKVDDTGQPAGTTVILNIPLKGY